MIFWIFFVNQSKNYVKNFYAGLQDNFRIISAANGEIFKPVVETISLSVT